MFKATNIILAQHPTKRKIIISQNLLENQQNGSTDDLSNAWTNKMVIMCNKANTVQVLILARIYGTNQNLVLVLNYAKYSEVLHSFIGKKFEVLIFTAMRKMAAQRSISSLINKLHLLEMFISQLQTLFTNFENLSF